MNLWASKQKGFTIVELLIVVVVIAILAAITIVAYNGIQNRAKDSALKSTANSVGKKILSYAPLNADLFPDEAVFATPASLATSSLGIPAATSQATYNYLTNDTRTSFCLSVTDTTKSPVVAYAFTNEGQSVAGRCTKNYVINPGAEGSTNLLNSAGAPTIAISTDTFSGWPQSGTKSFKMTATATGEMRVRAQTNTIPVTGDAIQMWVYVRNAASVARNFSLTLQGRNAANQVAGAFTGPAVSVAAGGVERLTLLAGTSQMTSLFSDAVSLEPMVSRVSGAVGDVFYVDNIMIGYGSDATNYYDGNSAGWYWTSTANDSYSFGPAL